jgi:hypothetical protein
MDIMGSVRDARVRVNNLSFRLAIVLRGSTRAEQQSSNHVLKMQAGLFHKLFVLYIIPRGIRHADVSSLDSDFSRAGGAWRACAAARVSVDLLWGDNSAQGVTPRQHNAAVIHYLRWGRSLRLLDGESGPLDQCATAGGTPVGRVALFQYSVALAADSFHTQELTGLVYSHPEPARPKSVCPTAGGRTLEVCTLRFGLWQLMWMAPCCRALRKR